jgi:O6-methylguanine-DNA--protein-cysteine methyltransferase
MKKTARVEYGIQITKPWSREMYNHNDEVAEVVKAKVHAMWMEAYEELEEFVEAYDDECDEDEISLQDIDWDFATEKMVEIQKAVTSHGFGFGYTVGQVAETVETEIENAPYYRLKEIAEELGLDLKKGFVGFN